MHMWSEKVEKEPQIYRAGQMAGQAKGKACAKVLRLERGPEELEGGQAESGNKKSS